MADARGQRAASPKDGWVGGKSENEARVLRVETKMALFQFSAHLSARVRRERSPLLESRII